MKKFFYELEYSYKDDNNLEHYFHIGYFSSPSKARKTKEELKNKPGFATSGGNFKIVKHAAVFKENVTNKSGLCLYELSHEYETDEYDISIVFGLYSSLNEAHRKMEKEKKRKPYSETIDGFCIAKCIVDYQIGWSEGFSLKE